jgi:phage tail-like protein
MSEGSPIYRPPGGFYYSVKITGDKAAGDLSFQEASGISVELGIEEFAEGGVNQYKHRLPTYPKYGNLVLKRGLALQESPLFRWCMATLQGDLASRIQPRNITVALLGPGKNGENAVHLKRWDLLRAWPVKWSISDLRSEKSELVIETLEFTYASFEVH